MDDLEDRSLARNIGLFLVLVVLANGLIFPGSTSADGLVQTFYLAFFLHVGFTLYDGRFGVFRTVTWVLLIAIWVATELAGFIGFIVPWGQLTFWAAARWADDFPIIAKVLANAPSWVWALSSILLLCLLSLDIAVMHRDAWRQNSYLRIGVFLLAVGIVALALGFVLGMLVERVGTDTHQLGGAPTQASTPQHIVPSWPTLALYALLRSIPNKLTGLAVTFAAILVPVIWPWMHVDVLRRGPMHLVWLLCCLIFAAVWIGLTYLGSRPPDSFVIFQSQILAICYFAFFLLVPPILRKLAVGKTGIADNIAQS
jgi:ubiquinol-cytochrome c reductase cytochrome b/c1 subunit